MVFLDILDIIDNENKKALSNVEGWSIVSFLQLALFFEGNLTF